MITGVEAAGLALATIPIILSAFELYANGISVTKRYIRYRTQFNELLRDLRAEHTIYVNTIQILLIGVVPRSEMSQFLADPRGERWKDPQFEGTLKNRLGQAYESYIATISKINECVDQFKERLRLDPSGKV
jgi:hypothetical protein